ncbi:hypothetical protein AB1L30_03510 [Bremerella sp. JC817]|uniref:hypothetical protein n=1 Tax=Bremerella sp. JC817 TaxID=3231756 RepID=UPI0034588895
MNGPGEVIAVIAVLVFISLIIRLGAGGLDHSRVREYVTRRGGKIISLQWAPFGPGFFGEKDSRIYQVKYRDKEGCIHEGYIKTSMLSGVYFTEDRIVSRPSKSQNEVRNDPPQSSAPVSVEDEKARLRKRLAELEELE